MKIFLLSLTLVLISCTKTVVPVKRNFPPAPPSLQQECPDLHLIPDGTTKLSEVLTVVTTNYSEYHVCKFKVESWNAWYTQQKQIFESIK